MKFMAYLIRLKRRKSLAAAFTMFTCLSLFGWQILEDTEETRDTPSAVQGREKEKYTPSAVQGREKEKYTPNEVTPEEFKDKIKDYQVPHNVGMCLTISCNWGRMGNKMFDFAILYGLSKLNNRTVCAMPCLLNTLEKVFKISTPKNRFPSSHQQNEFSIGNYLNPDSDNKIPGKASLIVKGVSDSYTFFHFVRSEIRKQFTFQDHLVEHAQNLLRRAALKGPQSVFVGVHVRRGDFTLYLPMLNKKLAELEFYQKAMDIFRRKYSSAVFVVVSDNMDWCRSNLADSDVFIHKEEVSAEYDLTLLAHCNHSIFSESTFGFWGAYLAGGQTIYLANVTAPGTWFYNQLPQDKYYLPEWLGIDDSRQWKNYTENKLLYYANEVIKNLFSNFISLPKV